MTRADARIEKLNVCSAEIVLAERQFFAEEHYYDWFLLPEQHIEFSYPNVITETVFG